MLVEEGRKADKHGFVAVALQLHALFKQRRYLKTALQGESERDESKLIDEGRQADNTGLLL